jgi:hypothetical protein
MQPRQRCYSVGLSREGCEAGSRRRRKIVPAHRGRACVLCLSGVRCMLASVRVAQIRSARAGRSANTVTNAVRQSVCPQRRGLAGGGRPRHGGAKVRCRYGRAVPCATKCTLSVAPGCSEYSAHRATGESEDRIRIHANGMALRSPTRTRGKRYYVSGVCVCGTHAVHTRYMRRTAYTLGCGRNPR